MNTTPWFKVFLPLVKDGRGGESYHSREVCVQADTTDEACKIAERAFLPRGCNLDDFPTASAITFKQLIEFRNQQKETQEEFRAKQEVNMHAQIHTLVKELQTNEFTGVNHLRRRTRSRLRTGVV